MRKDPVGVFERDIDLDRFGDIDHKGAGINDFAFGIKESCVGNSSAAGERCRGKGDLVDTGFQREFEILYGFGFTEHVVVFQFQSGGLDFGAFNDDLSGIAGNELGSQFGSGKVAYDLDLGKILILPPGIISSHIDDAVAGGCVIHSLRDQGVEFGGSFAVDDV